MSNIYSFEERRQRKTAFKIEQQKACFNDEGKGETFASDIVEQVNTGRIKLPLEVDSFIITTVPDAIASAYSFDRIASGNRAEIEMTWGPLIKVMDRDSGNIPLPFYVGNNIIIPFSNTEYEECQEAYFFLVDENVGRHIAIVTRGK